MEAILHENRFRHDRFWVWIGMAIAIGWIIGLNILILFSLEIFNRMSPISPQNMLKACSCTRPAHEHFLLRNQHVFAVSLYPNALAQPTGIETE